MALIVPHSGEVQILKALLFVSGCKLKLFSNNVTISASSVIGDFTIMSGGGYADFTLLSGSWGFVSGTPSRATYNQFISFTFSGAPAVPTCYGYIVVDPSGNLYYGENITPVTGINASTVIPILPQLTCQSLH